MATSQHEPPETRTRYTVHSEIASGGMATVHLGRLLSAHGFAKTVAIKELHDTFARNKDFVGRFLDEARLVARISHPNVMPTLDIISEDDHLRIVMEYVKGESLDHLEAAALTRGEKTPPRIACAIMVGALHGLHAAHEAKNEFGEPLGIVHLDVSPQNILVGTDGVARVLDFGLARAQGQKTSGEVSGKVGYMAPEQIKGAEVSPRTDVFSASIVLWELLTGQSLFLGDNYAATIQRVLSGPIPSLHEVVQDVPAGLDAVLKTGLMREPGGRFSSARDMALAIEKLITLAPASEVGTWVQTTCRDTLAARAAQVQAMESESARPNTQASAFVSPRELYAEQAASNLDSSDIAYEDTASLLRPPGKKGSMFPQRAKDGSVRWKPKASVRPMPMSMGVVVLEEKPRAPRWKIWAFVGGAVVVVALVALVLRVVFLPGYIKDAAIAAAAAQGLELTVTSARLDSGAVVLEGLGVKLTGVPQVSATIGAATAQISVTGPPRVRLDTVEIAIDGDAKATLTALSAWWAAHHSTTARVDPRGAGTSVEVPTAHLVWTSPFGADVSRIEMKSLQGSIIPTASQRTGDELHLLSPEVTMDTSVGRFGAWNVDFDQSVTGRRIRLAFDPAVLDGADATLILDAHAGTTFDLEIPHIPTGRLGIPPNAFGTSHPLPQQVEAKMHYARLGSGAVTTSLKMGLFSLRLAQLGSTVDVHASGDATGTAGAPLALKDGAFALGPLSAAVYGTIDVGEAHTVANLNWKADPIPCANLLALPKPTDALRDAAHQVTKPGEADLEALIRDMGALAQASGAVKVTGTLTATGTAVVDSAEPRRVRLSVQAKNACGLALFQGK